MSGLSLRELSENEREILAIIWRSGAIPRSDVSRHTKLAQQSVHRLLDGLRADRFLSFGDPEIRGRGQPSPTVEIDGSYFATIGIAVNSEAVRYSVADLRGKPLAFGEMDEPPNDREAVLSGLERLIAGWSAGLLRERRVIGLGISMQGYRTAAGDVFQPSRRLSGWHDLPLVPLFEKRFNLKAFPENNASSSAVAELFLGHGHGYDCFAYLSFNSGFGGGLIFRNNVFLGNHGNAGEIGTLFTEAQKPLRPALIGLIERLRAAGRVIPSMNEFRTAFQADDPIVLDWLDQITPQLQLAIRALKAVADPGAIFFGGDAPDALRHQLVKVAEGAFGPETSPSPALRVSGIDGDAAHLGAAYLPLHRQIY